MSENYGLIPFRPVRGDDRTIKSKAPTQGYVYFATDTKKIYLGEKDSFIPMGGNSGIYYGNRFLTEDEEESENTVFDFADVEIEGDQLPNVDDLILNIPDGCFYRVLSTNSIGDIFVTAERLTIAGSGGGGSGGGGTGSSTPIIMLDDSIKTFTFAQEKMQISFRGELRGEIGNNKIDMVQYYLGPTLIYTDTKGYDFNETIYFDIAPYKKQLSTSTSNTLNIKITDIYGAESKRKAMTINVVDLKIESDFDSIYLLEGNQLNYRCNPSGGSTLSRGRYIEITITPVDNPNYIIEQLQSPVTSAGYRPIVIDLTDKCSHGIYKLEATLCGILDDGTIISSPSITHQIIYYDNTVNTPLIAGYVPANTIQQYDTLNILYMIADKETALVEADVSLYVGEVESKEKALVNKVNTWKKLFTEVGTYTLKISYQGYSVELQDIIVKKYEGELPTIDTTGLELSLSAAGRNNNEANKDSWVSGEYEGQFEGFLWGNSNGWLPDSEGSTALKLTNGAKFSLPTYHPFREDATINGLTIELDFMFSGVLDYSKPLIQCLSVYDNTIATGFHITGQKATLNSNNTKATSTELGGEEDSDGKINEQDMALQGFTQFFNEDTRIHLAYVIQSIPSTPVAGKFYFVYTYLNGVLSGIMRMNENSEEFKDNINAPSFIEIDSSYGDIYIYNIRVYRAPLLTRTIINNYIAGLTDINKKMALYKDNNIFDDNGLISYNAIKDLSYQLGVPYVLLKGGSVMNKKKTNTISYSETPEYRLPLTKSDYRLMSMQMFDRLVDNENPVIDIPMELKNVSTGEIISDFKQIQTSTEYKPQKGVQVYGQGTSSMVYPVKNLRLKFIQEEDYPIVYKGSCPVEIVCFKADYMDSSSSHNTATANLIYDLYANMGMKTPPQTFRTTHLGEEGVTEYDLVTAIRGFPIVCFYSEGDSDNYTYIGRYNFNLDKATPEPFGFIPQLFYTGETVKDDQGRDRKVVETIGYLTESINGKKVLPLNDKNEEIKRDIVQCWEILNNDTGSPTKFLMLKDSDTNVPLYSNFKESLTKNYNWTNYYEDRYPDAMVAGAEWILNGRPDKDKGDEYVHLEEDLENGIYRLACWINSTAKEEATNATLNEIVYYSSLDTSYNAEKTYYVKEDGNYKALVIEETAQATIAAGISLDEQFKNNLSPTINVETFKTKVGNAYGQYTFVYSDEQWYLGQEETNLEDYGISYTGTPVETNTLIVNYFTVNNWTPGLYEAYASDNAAYRIAKFKNEFEQYFDLDFSLFYYTLTLILLMMDSRAKNMMLASWDQTIWYPIFYDMDTMLGLNNTGFNKFSFDTEDDPKDKVFNGYDSVLWNNFRECFYNEICSFYARMRTNGGLNIDKLLKTYNAGSADKWNEALSTADAEYKYIRPYERGYYDGKEGTEIKPGQVSYLYAGQGKRSNHRAWWVSNRIKYLDSKCLPSTYGSQKPSSDNTFSFRAYALPEQKSTQAAEECVAQTPASHKFDLKALNNSYQSLFIGNIVYGPQYTLAGEIATLGSAQVKHEVESYILNANLIASLGDLSNKYLGQFNFPGQTTRLTELSFGRSSRSHPEAYDKYYNGLLSALNIANSCPYLTKLNIARCIGLKDISLRGCPRLTELDAEGSKLTNIDFAENSILTNLYLPNTLTSLTLKEQPYLSNIVFDDLSIATQKIQKIVLDKINPAFNSYDIVKNIFNTTNIKSYYLNNINWVITEEQPVDEDTGKIKAITLLDILADPTRSSPIEGYSSAQALSGTITLKIPGAKVNEFFIYEKYLKTTFPNLIIKYEDMVVEPATHIEFMRTEEANSSVFYDVYSDGEKSIAQLTANKPIGIPQKQSTKQKNYIFADCWKSEDSIIYSTNNTEISYAVKRPSLASNVEFSINEETFKNKVKSKGEYLITYRIDYDEGGQTKWYLNGNQITPIEYGIEYQGDIDVIEGETLIIQYRDYLGKLIPTKNCRFYPVYIEVDRLYKITLHPYDGTESFEYNYRGSIYGTSYTLPVVWYRPVTTEDKFSEDEIWMFTGWSRAKETLQNPVDPNNFIVEGDTVLYGHYKKVNYRTYAPEDWFEYQEVTRKLADGKTYSGLEVSLKVDYIANNGGILTIPNQHNGQNIIGISNFTHFDLNSSSGFALPFTKIVFANTEQSKCVYVADKTFGAISFKIEGTEDYIDYTSSELKEIELPKSIIEIGDYAFYRQSNLEKVYLNDKIIKIGNNAFSTSSNPIDINPMKVQINELPTALIFLGSNAFFNYTKNNSIQITKLPAGVTAIEHNTFTNCANVNITDFSNIVSIGIQPFLYAGQNLTSNSSIVIGGKIEKLAASNVFGGYGATGMKVVFKNTEDYFYGVIGLSEDAGAEEIVKYFGFNTSSYEFVAPDIQIIN